MYVNDIDYLINNDIILEENKLEKITDFGEDKKNIVLNSIQEYFPIFKCNKHDYYVVCIDITNLDTLGHKYYKHTNIRADYYQ